MANILFLSKNINTHKGFLMVIILHCPIKKLRLDRAKPLSAERQGFEPWVPVRVQRFSRPSRSTTPASFLVLWLCGCKGNEKKEISIRIGYDFFIFFVVFLFFCYCHYIYTIFVITSICRLYNLHCLFIGFIPFAIRMLSQA